LNLRKSMRPHSLKLGLESLESRKLCAADLAADLQTAPSGYFASAISFHNASKPADVDGDGSVSPIDALRLIDMLNRSTGSVDLVRLQASRSASGAEGEQDQVGNVDTNNDGSLNPIDVLVVIDALNASNQSEAPADLQVCAAFDSEFRSESTEDPVVCYPFAYSTGFPVNEFPFGEFDFEKFIDWESVDWSEYDFSEVTPEQFEMVYDDVGFNEDWVKRGGVSEEMPMMFSEEFPTFESDDAAEFQPVFALMNNFLGSLNSVALFSQNGLLAQVIQKNQEEVVAMDVAPVAYFSSNFLRNKR